jgi:ornithine carbamoyltransferase
MRHFVDLTDWSSEEIKQLLDLARQLKNQWKSGGNQPVLKGKVLAMIFQKPSLRTRVSFEVGMQHLGGSAIMLGPDEIGFGKRESTADIAHTLSRYVQGIMARVFAHDDVLELAKHATVPVINGLSDGQHPCQAMADMLTIYERFGRMDGLKVAFVGDGNNVAASLAQVCAHMGTNFAIGTPPGYELPEEIMERVGDFAAQNGATMEGYHNPHAAVQNADVIYTDTWVSMGQDAEAEPRNRAMKPFQVNVELLDAAPKHAIVMHCLPAHRGHEITDEVADGPQSVIFDQAENRMHVQKAILVKLLRDL